MELPQGVSLASVAVNVDGVNEGLWSFVCHLGLIHQLLFSKPLVITSGRDSLHSAASMHPKGDAVDVRTKDLLPDEQMLLLNVLAYAGPSSDVAVFDERALPGQEHLHLEWHGK
jgi:hypothetical protein